MQRAIAYAGSVFHARRAHAKPRISNNLVSNPALGGLTLSRSAGGIYYFDSNNVLQYTGDNVAAFEAAGLRVEGQETNLVAAASYRDFSTWTGFNTTMGATTPTLIDGTTPASGKNEVVEDTTATVQHRRQFTFTAASAGKHTIVIFAKRGTGTRHLQIVASNATDGNWLNVRTDLASTPTIANNTTSNFATVETVGSWVMFILTGTIVTTGTQTINFYLHNGTTNSYTGDGASSIILDWITIAVSGCPQSPIQGGATRYTSFFSRPWIGASKNFWVYVDFYFLYSSQALTVASLYPFAVRKDASNYLIARFVSGGTGALRIATANAGVAQEVDILNFSIDRGDRCRMVVSYDEVNGLRCRASNNGAAAQTSVIATSKADIGALSAAATFYLGNLDSATTTTVNRAHYRDYRFGTGILTVAQQQELIGA